MSNLKPFIDQWCKKNNVDYVIETKFSGAKNCLRYYSKLRAHGHKHIGAGCSITQENSEINAVKDFIEYLVKSNFILADDVPESPEEVLNNGNWTTENAKGRLNNFLQVNKIKGEYQYSVRGPDHSREFSAEMSFFVPQLGRKIYGHGRGSNKVLSSKRCALAIVRELYHSGTIEAFSKDDSKQEFIPKVELLNDLLHQIDHQWHKESLEVALEQKIKLVDKMISLTSLDYDQFCLASDLIDQIIELGKHNELHPCIVLGETKS